MDETAQLRVEIALLRARVDALQNDLLDLVTLHSQTVEAMARVADLPGPNRRSLQSNR